MGSIGVSSWPSGWPSFTPEDNDASDTYQQDLKKAIVAEYGADALRQAWIKTCRALSSSVTPLIAAKGSAAVPVFSYDEVVSSPPADGEVMARMKATGCFIVRGVIPEEEATERFEEMQTFLARNEGDFTGWPAKSPAIFHLYSTPVQLKLRTHPRQLKLQRLLNSLFTDSSCSADELQQQHEPVLYPDAFRIRASGQEFLGLGPHVDGGSLSRWADEKYRKTYEKILSGHPEDYDPYDLTERRDANPALFPSGVHSTVLRAFQGWTALTACAPGEGGLMVMPDIKTVTAYMILRPFFKAPEDGDWEDPERWEFDDSAWFPGVKRWDSQLLSPASHPHLYLEDTLVSVPPVQPGDTIWWHADMCHAVETTHNGTHPASVVYIPAAPSTPINKAYIRQHWKDILAGIPPDDYKYLDGTGSELILSKQNERKMVGALSLESISAEGRRGLGEGM